MTAKILAVIFATMLWLYVMNEQNPPVEVSFQAPLEVRNLAGSLIVTDVPDIVRVKVRGPRSAIAAITAQDIKCYIDLKGLEEGQHSVKIHTSIPASLEVVEVMPDKVRLVIDSIISRQLPVDVNLKGTPLSGAAIGKVLPSVAQVKVVGTRSVMDAAEKVVAQVDVSGRSADFTVEAPLIAVDHEGKAVEGLTLYPATINVSLTISNLSRKTVPVKAVLANELAKGLILQSITAEPDKVELLGDGQLLEKVDAILTEPINLTEINKSMDKEVKLQLREGITVQKNTVLVHITVEKKL
ncbi:MAG: CdaR family protein [Veillonellales bacterium]